MTLTAEQIAGICHEANRAYCAVLGDDSQPTWDDAPDWQRKSAIAGVEAKLADWTLWPPAMHEKWRQHKLAEGWVYGPIKDAQEKTHPCMVDWAELPVEQRLKDYLFSAIVSTFAEARPPVAREPQGGSCA